MRDSFIFYRSFYEAINDLDDQSQLQLYKAIASFSLNEEDGELSGLVKTIFTLIKPQLEANNQRYKNGKRPKNKKQEGSKPEANQKQEGSKPEANKNKNNNNNVNKNTNNNTNKNVEEKKDKIIKEDAFSLKTHNPDDLASLTLEIQEMLPQTLLKQPSNAAMFAGWVDGKVYDIEEDIYPSVIKTMERVKQGKLVLKSFAYIDTIVKATYKDRTGTISFDELKHNLTKGMRV